MWVTFVSVLAREIGALGFRAMIGCVDSKALDPSFAGRDFDSALLDDLPEHIDPCGENGEFHIFVHDGPMFPSSIPLVRGEVVERDGFIFQDLMLPSSNRSQESARPVLTWRRIRGRHTYLPFAKPLSSPSNCSHVAGRMQHSLQKMGGGARSDASSSGCEL